MEVAKEKEMMRNMKLLFRNTTKYDKENRKNFTDFHQKKYGRKELIHTILFCLCIIYILIFNLINSSWHFWIIVVIVLPIIYFFYKYATKKKKQKTKKQKNREYTFFFYEGHIKIKSKRQFERMTYFEIKKVFETNENFFLYTDDTHSLILDKDGFEVGNEKDFAEFIKKKCPFKYRNKEEK